MRCSKGQTMQPRNSPDEYLFDVGLLLLTLLSYSFILEFKGFASGFISSVEANYKGYADACKLEERCKIEARGLKRREPPWNHIWPELLLGDIEDLSFFSTKRLVLKNKGISKHSLSLFNFHQVPFFLFSFLTRSQHYSCAVRGKGL